MSSAEALPNVPAPIDEYLSSHFIDNMTICAGTSKDRCQKHLRRSSDCLDNMIGELLVGLSGRIVWGVVQIILMMFGNVGKATGEELEERF